MATKARTEVLVGAFVIFGFVLLSLVVLFVSGVYLIRPGYRVNVMYDYVNILDKGAPIRMAGVRIGEITKVDLVEDKETGQVRVKLQLFIAKEFEIRENYMFSIRGTHILSEPHIEITPQPGTVSYLKDGATVEGVEPVPLEILIDRANQIASHLEAILGKLRAGVEDKENEEAIRDTIQNMAKLSRTLNEVFSGSQEDMAETLKHLNASTQSLESVLSKIEKGEGTVGKLVSEKELYEDIRAFVQDIKTHPWKLLRGGEKKGVRWVPFV